MRAREEYNARMPKVTGARGKKWTETKVAGRRAGDVRWG